MRWREDKYVRGFDYDPDRVSECWIQPGSPDNGNLLWITYEGRDVVLGGFRSTEEAQGVATECLGWDAEVRT
jgi:hypothetical protein